MPLFVLSMGRDVGLFGHWAHAGWVNWLFWALATPVQFWVGRDFYASAVKSLRGGSANMDVLVALGSSVAYFYSVVVTLGVMGGHVYFETSAAIITLIATGELWRPSLRGAPVPRSGVDGPASQDRPRGARRRGARTSPLKRCALATWCWCGPARRFT